MKTLIVANWKLNPSTLKEAKVLFDAIKKDAKGRQVVICPPFIYLPLLKKPVLNLLNRLTLGAQNVSVEEKGPFTGEISALQLKDLRVEYVIIGHSERRKYFSETDEMVNKKIKNALNAGLKIIFCIGENAGEDKNTILEKQIINGLKDIPSDNVKDLTIAYEPVWAISSGDGRGNNCSVSQTLSSVLLIKKIISNLYNRELADNIKILYGGSVNSSNSAEYIKNGQVDGLLIGGASLDAKEFIKIVKSVV